MMVSLPITIYFCVALAIAGSLGLHFPHMLARLDVHLRLIGKFRLARCSFFLSCYWVLGSPGISLAFMGLSRRLS